ncbi:MAG: class aminotransferase [Rickettsiales bacterium]|jgi:uncharacterized protein (DUF849 family)|nr:class aminotransferase [Rickettsiales bacterium]
MSEPLIIMVAPNGARKLKSDAPAIPLSIPEIAAEAKACADAGASIFHLHIRNAEGKHILDAEQYRETIAAIREKTGDTLIVQTTTEAVGIYSPEQQIAVAKALVPEAASYGLKEFIPDVSYEKQAGEFFHWSSGAGIFAQYILYSPEDIKYFAELRQRGVIPASAQFVLFVLGKKHAPANSVDAYAKPDDVLPYIEAFNAAGLHEQGVTWAVCAFGGNERACMLKVAELGGHARIGFENNHLLADGSMAPGNWALVKEFREVLGDKRSIATADDVRKRFGVKTPVRKAA